MTIFLDGPAQNDGQFVAGSQPLRRAPSKPLLLRRAPHFLRAVVSRVSGDIDALDQLTDTPTESEDVYAYVMVSGPSSMHICARGKDRGRAGFYQGGTYRLCDPQPTNDQLRDHDAWRGWVADQVGSPIAPDGTVQAAQP